jgi:hypothetical protein
MAKEQDTREIAEAIVAVQQDYRTPPPQKVDGGSHPSGTVAAIGGRHRLGVVRGQVFLSRRSAGLGQRGQGRGVLAGDLAAWNVEIEPLIDALPERKYVESYLADADSLEVEF